MEVKIENNIAFTGNVLNYISGMFYKCEYDDQWTKTYISEGCEQLTGYSKEELLNNHALFLDDLLHPDDKKWSLNNCLLFLDGNAAHTHECRIITKKGNVKYVKNVLSAGYDEDGKLLYVEGFMQDNLMAIKERKFLKDLNAYKRAINESLIVMEVDSNGKIRSANSQFCGILHYRIDELAGSNMESLEPGISKILSQYYEQKQHSPQKTFRSVVAIDDKVGGKHWMDQVIVPVFKDNEVEKYVFMCLEITENLSSDRLKNEYIKMLEDMLFMVSHKVRQPVSLILGLTHLIEENLISAEELAKVSGFIKDAAAMLDDVTQEMSQFLADHHKKHY